MAQKSYRKSQLIAFNNVAAGHDGVLSDRSGAVVVKPCKQAEIDFYHSVAAEHPHFAMYIPTFICTHELNPAPDVAATLTPTAAANLPETPIAAPPAISQIPVVEKAWAPSNGGKITTDLAIVLENVAAPFKKPNILDVKLGARLWDDDAPPAKRAKLDKVAAETTSKPLGFRIAGMRTWQGSTTTSSSHTEGVANDGYKLYDKSYGRQFSAETIRQGFEDFFLVERDGGAKGPVRDVISRFAAHVEELHFVLEREESRMYSASLLFVYEGDPDALQAALDAENHLTDGVDGDETHEDSDDDDDDDDEKEMPAVQVLKLIDFAHARWTPGQGKDENLLHGLSSVMGILDGLMSPK
ncbi:MAG: hypothetical protein L6R39_005751 [Caloplaca ligustica]|nr:MAG: hypothetical protein L6R39_005751 [Caloplaca ligustica]